MQLRVLTLNIWNTEGDSRRIGIINRGLHELNPDLIALQEVVQTEEKNQLEELLQGLEHHSTHQAEINAVAPPFAERYGGVAIASRWSHHAVEACDLRLPDAPDVPWNALAVLVEIPQEGSMLFITAATAWRTEAESARERQVLKITDLDARYRTDLPTIIAGDFNASPDNASIRYMTGRQSLGGQSVAYHDAWEVAGHGSGETWTVDNPNARQGIEQVIRQPNYRRRFDYVFVASWHAHPKAHSIIRTANLAFDQPVDGIWASDHFGVVVDLEVGMDH